MYFSVMAVSRPSLAAVMALVWPDRGPLSLIEIISELCPMASGRSFFLVLFQKNEPWLVGHTGTETKKNVRETGRNPPTTHCADGGLLLISWFRVDLASSLR